MISVIVPVYLGGSDLHLCIRSILDEIEAEDEVVVVADGESDRAWEGIDGPRVRVLVNPSRRGPAYARNRGAEVARGDLFFFIDADCVVRPGTLARVRQIFGENPTLSAIVGSYDDAPAHPSFPSQYRNLLHHYTHQRSLTVTRTFWGACGAVRREAFFEVDGFDENYGWPCIEDIELGYRLTEAGHKIHMVKDVQVQHLKEWTVRSIVRTDVFLRAAPWAELLLQYNVIDDNLNTSRRSRVSVATTGLGSGLALLSAALLGGGAVGAAGVAALGAAASVSATVVFNLSFYQYLRKIRGRRFALRAVPWHLLYFASAGAGAALGALRFAFRGASTSRRALRPGLRSPHTAPATSSELARAV